MQEERTHFLFFICYFLFAICYLLAFHFRFVRCYLPFSFVICHLILGDGPVNNPKRMKMKNGNGKMENGRTWKWKESPIVSKRTAISVTPQKRGPTAQAAGPFLPVWREYH